MIEQTREIVRRFNHIYGDTLVEPEILLPDNATNSARLAGTVTAGQVFVDGYGVGDVGSVVLRDRKHLAEDGMIVVEMCIRDSPLCDAGMRSAQSGPAVSTGQAGRGLLPGLCRPPLL